MKRPTHCPFCYEKVEKTRPYKWRIPPDERDDFPPPLSTELWDDFPRPVPTVDALDCYLMVPCGHVFREDDVRGFAADLGVRVMNPNSPVENGGW